MKKGFLIIEIIIALSIFMLLSSVLSMLVFQYQGLLQGYSLRIKALALTQEYLSDSLEEIQQDFYNMASYSAYKDGFEINVSILDIDNFTKKSQVEVSYSSQGRKATVVLEGLQTDVVGGEGQSSCRPIQDKEKWKNPMVNSIDILTLVPSIYPTDIDMVGNYIYITSDSATAADPDLFIFDVSDKAHVRLISSLQTGPGLLSLQVVGRKIYVGNSSINSQLQIIDISDKSNPRLMYSYKLPGVYSDATTVGNKIFYKQGRVYLGTRKSQIAELHLIDVINAPQEIASYEIGSAVNDLLAYKDVLYVATPDNAAEVKVFSLANGLEEVNSYDFLGSSGGANALSLFLNTLRVGRTITSNNSDELFAFAVASSSLSMSSHFPAFATVQGIISYTNLFFMLLNKAEDGFRVYDESDTQINKSPIIFPSRPLSFDCDRDEFAIILQDSHVLYLITHS